MGADVLTPVYSYLSLTEESEYITTEEEYVQTLDSSLRKDSAKLEEVLRSFRERMKHYRQERVYPTLPDWPVVCFYNMSKRRGEQRNWYALPYDERRKLMKGHANVGREFAGKVKQLITGSTGLDDAEWGVTLFARDTFQIRRSFTKCVSIRSAPSTQTSASFMSAFNCRSTNCSGDCNFRFYSCSYSCSKSIQIPKDYDYDHEHEQD